MKPLVNVINNDDFDLGHSAVENRSLMILTLRIITNVNAKLEKINISIAFCEAIHKFCLEAFTYQYTGNTQVQAVTSQLGGSAHKRGIVSPETGRIVLYTYRDITLTFTVKVSMYTGSRIFISGVEKTMHGCFFHPRFVHRTFRPC